VLRKPIRLGVLLINVYLCPINGRVYVGIAMNADKIIGRPAVCHVYACGKAGGIVGTKDFVRGVPAQAYFKTRVATEDIRKVYTHDIVYILLAEAVSLCSSVWTSRVVPLVNEYLDGQKNHLLVTVYSSAGRVDDSILKRPDLNMNYCMVKQSQSAKAASIAGISSKSLFVFFRECAVFLPPRLFTASDL